MNFAPRLPTIIVALALMLVGLLAVTGLLPVIGGIAPSAVGAWAFLAAGVVLVLGMVFEGI